MPRLLLFVLPLALDTFAVAAALGIGGRSRRERLRVSLILSGFEAAMPLLGLVVGLGLGELVGGVAELVSAGALLAVGGWMLLEEDGERAASLVDRRGLALLAAGAGISLDELAIGFSLGLLGLPVAAAIVLIGAQAFLAAQLGLRLGARLGEAAREGAERLAAFALIALGLLILAEQLLR